MFVHLVIPCFHFPLNVFSFALRTKLSLPHPLALSLTHCIYDQPLDPMGIHLFHYAHGGEKTTSHDVVQDAFISIVRYMAFHVWRDQTTFFCHLFFNIFVCVDIVLLIDGIGTLTNVVIVNATQANMASSVTLPMGWLQH